MGRCFGVSWENSERRRRDFLGAHETATKVPQRLKLEAEAGLMSDLKVRPQVPTQNSGLTGSLPKKVDDSALLGFAV